MHVFCLQHVHRSVRNARQALSESQQQSGRWQVLQLRRDGNFPFLLWKDTAPQHFESTFGEYPQVSIVARVKSYCSCHCPQTFHKPPLNMCLWKAL